MTKRVAAARSGSATGTIMMLVAIVAVVGLLFWLSVASRPAEVAQVATGDTADAGPAAPTAPPVAAAEFGANMRAYWGQEVDLQGVTVAQVMSKEIVWVELPPGGTPFPVKLSGPLAAAGGPALGERINIEGMVLQKTDSVLNAWQASGAIENDGQRQQAEFGSTFLEARQIRPARAPGA